LHALTPLRALTHASRTQAFPRWVSCSSGLTNCSGNPYTLPEKTASYVVSWVQGAKAVYDVDVDYIGSWVRGCAPASPSHTLSPHARAPLSNAE
jgi:hypothetical protein